MNATEFLAQVRAEHVPYRVPRQPTECYVCVTPWPCGAERLARAIEAVLAVCGEQYYDRDAPAAAINEALEAE